MTNDEYRKYVISTEASECKNYFERVKLRFAKSTLGVNTFRNLKYHVAMGYFLSFNFFFYISSNFNYYFENKYENYLNLISEYFGFIGFFIIMIFTFVGAVPGVILLVIIIWSIFK